MMIDALVCGRVVGQPLERRSHPDKPPIATCKVCVKGSGETWFVHCTAYSADHVAAVMGLADGQSVALTGELRPKVRVDGRGAAHPSFDLVVHGVLALKLREAA